jgi:hypothetical protein
VTSNRTRVQELKEQLAEIRKRQAEQEAMVKEIVGQEDLACFGGSKGSLGELSSYSGDYNNEFSCEECKR